MTRSTLLRSRYIARFLTACAFSLVIMASANAQGKQDFTLHNETGKTIKEVYVSPSATDDWEEDILGEDTLENGDSQEITFTGRQKADNWDIMVVFRDGKKSTWTKLNLSKITDVTISYKNGKPWATWKCEGCN